MFADLIRYEEQSYQKEHPVILFDTWKERGEYQIIGILRVPDVEEEMAFYRNMQCGDEKQYEAFVKEVKGRSLYDCGAVSYTHLDVYKRQAWRWYRTAWRRHRARWSGTAACDSIDRI